MSWLTTFQRVSSKRSHSYCIISHSRSRTSLLIPTETHLLVTNITEIDPRVVCFSPDGGSFYVYDQSAFAQKYLPQYFKHSNYGSFVRQLNLYGFASSRHKDNSDVVVWSHQFFHRDRKDLLKRIKRAVKPKSSKAAKPSHVHVTPPLSTALSVSSEEVSYPTSPSHDLEDSLTRQASSKCDEWLEAEFAILKEQNRHLMKKLEDSNRLLEEKLDFLLKITLTLSPSSLEEFHSGEKRRRMYQNQAVPTNPHQAYRGKDHVLETIREDARLARSNNAMEPTSYHNEGRMPYKSPEAENQESMKAFVDIMLSDEKEEECEANSGSDSDITNDEPDAVDQALANYEDELMHVMENGLCDDDEFNLSFDETEELPEAVPAPEAFVQGTHSYTNRADDKTSGPQPLLSSDSMHQYGDVEEGNVPIGVHIVSAQAELVDDDGSKDDNSIYERRAWRKRVVCLLTFMFVVIVVTSITVPTVIWRKRSQQPIIVIEGKGKGSGPFRPPDGTLQDWDEWHHSEDQENPSDNLEDGADESVPDVLDYDGDDAFYPFATETLNSGNLTNATSGTRSAPNIFSSTPMHHGQVRGNPLYVSDGFSLTIGDIDFTCNPTPR